MLPSVAQNGDTLCIFMGLGRIPQWAPVLESVMPAETPAAIVYRAGYSSGETVIHTTLADLPKAADAQPEKFLGLIYVGPCVTAQRVAECQP
jgi:precorrin-4 methylase